jgi:hypothetical protein
MMYNLGDPTYKEALPVVEYQSLQYVLSEHVFIRKYRRTAVRFKADIGKRFIVRLKAWLNTCEVPSQAGASILAQVKAMRFFKPIALVALLPAVLAIEGQTVTSKDGITNFVSAEYVDRDIPLPDGTSITVRFYGNHTLLPGPQRRAWTPTGGPSNQCGIQEPGNWQGVTSGNSPNEADCAELAYAISFSPGYWTWGPQDVGLNYFTFVARQTCAFGVGLMPATCVNFSFGDTDVTDLIRDSIRMHAREGKLGSQGQWLYCDSYAPNQRKCATKWAIYHT